MKDTIICDLDGTLANCEHRVHHVQSAKQGGKPKNWDAFYAGVKDDEANYPVLNLLRTYIDWAFGYQAGYATTSDWFDYHLIFCSGRPERCRADTDWWLQEVCEFDHTEYTLYMRKDGDHRQDYIVKQEILDEHIDKERVLFVLDDRQQVVDMWRRNGLTCFQVAEGNF